MLNKYNQLKDMLNKKYNISAFDDISEVEEFFMVDTNTDDTCLSVYVEGDKLEIVIEENIEGDWYKTNHKFYKNVRSAYNFIRNFIED